MEFISKQSIADFKNPGVTSRQLLNPNNSIMIRLQLQKYT